MHPALGTGTVTRLGWHAFLIFLPGQTKKWPVTGQARGDKVDTRLDECPHVQVGCRPSPIHLCIGCVELVEAKN